MIDLAALVQETGDALEGSADFPRFPEHGVEREMQVPDNASFSRVSRVSRHFEQRNEPGTDPINSEAGLPHENGVRIGRAHEASFEERETREIREKPCRERVLPFPFLERETGKAGNPTPAGGFPVALSTPRTGGPRSMSALGSSSLMLAFPAPRPSVWPCKRSPPCTDLNLMDR